MDSPITINATVNSVEDYISIINKDILPTAPTPEWNDANMEHRILYRGHADESYELLPSLARFQPPGGTLGKGEENILAMCRYKHPEIFSQKLSPVDTLSLLQHYGAPTRLLDVTENPLVALYFACKTLKDKDGEVIAFMDNQTSAFLKIPLSFKPLRLPVRLSLVIRPCCYLNFTISQMMQ